MKKIFIILFILSSFATFSQGPSTGTYTPINTTGYNWIRGYFRALNLPVGCGYPTLKAGQWVGSGAVYLDSCLNRPYYYNQGLWYPILDSATIVGMIGSLTPDLQQVTDIDSVTTNGIFSARYRLGNGGNNYFGTYNASTPMILKVNDNATGSASVFSVNYLWQFGNTAIPGFEDNPIPYTHIGYEAGKNAALQPTPPTNLFVGNWSGRDVTTGTGNALGGQLVGASGTTIHRNAIWGNGAFKYSKTGIENSGTGQFVFEVSRKADYGAGVGSNFGRGNKDGDNNTGAGAYGLYRGTTIIDTVLITAGGSLYTTATGVFSAPDAATSGTISSTATGTVILSGGAVIGVAVTSHGGGYSNETTPPTFTITGDGSGATATVVLRDSKENTAVGGAALAYDPASQGITAIGFQAGGGDFTNQAFWDENMTYLGYKASRSSATVSIGTRLKGGTGIGANVKVACDSCVILGDIYARSGIGIINPHASAALDVTSVTRGLLAPRMTEVQRDAIVTPATGLLIYQIDGTDGFYYYDGAAWTAIGSGSGGSTLFPITGTGGPATGAVTADANGQLITIDDIDEFTINKSSVARVYIHGTATEINSPNATGSLNITNNNVNVIGGTARANINQDSVSFVQAAGIYRFRYLPYANPDTTVIKVRGINADGEEVWTNWAYAGGGTSYTFQNGLTEAAGTVKLGGALTENTTITGASGSYLLNATGLSGSVFRTEPNAPGYWGFSSVFPNSVSITAGKSSGPGPTSVAEMIVNDSLKFNSSNITANTSLSTIMYTYLNGTKSQYVLIDSNHIKFKGDTISTLPTSIPYIDAAFAPLRMEVIDTITGIHYRTAIPTGGASGITIGTTTITSGTDTYGLFQDGSVVGEDAGFTYNKTTDALTITGSVTSGKFIPTGSTVPANGMYLPAANTLGFATNSTLAASINASQEVLIATTDASAAKLQLGGAMRFNFDGGEIFFNGTTNYIANYSTSNYYVSNNLHYFNTAGVTALALQGGSASVGTGTVGAGSWLNIAAGTTTKATENWAIGVFKTTPVSGDWDRDANRLRYTNATAIPQFVELSQPTRVSTQYDNTTTTLGNITGLTANVDAGDTYYFEATLYTTSNVGGGVKVAIGGTATTTALVYEVLITDAGLTTQGRSAATGVTAVTGAYIKITGTATINASGTILPQFAANAATGTSSVLVGSLFNVTQIN